MNKTLYIVALLLTLAACTGNNAPKTSATKTAQTQIVKSLQYLLDSAKLQGAIVVFDSKANNYFTNNKEAAHTGQLPASTFKIANTIVGLETGVLTDTTMFIWQGNKRRFKLWEQDLVLKDAFQYSCVPCYQEVARNIGFDTMKSYLDKMHYGNMQFSESNIDSFWLVGNSRISPMQQIDFLQQLYHEKLPVSQSSQKLMKELLILEQTNTYTLSAKTGWSNDNGIHNGWLVGYIERNNGLYFFATNISPTPGFDMKNFPKVRKDISLRAFKQLGIID